MGMAADAMELMLEEVLSQGVVEQIDATARGEAPASDEAASGASATESAAAAASRLTWDQLQEALKSDEDLARQFQAETDRRAAAQANAQSRQERLRIQQEEQAAARQKAEADYQELVRNAANPDQYNDEANAARLKLAEMASTRLLRQSWESEQLPALQQTVGQQMIGAMDQQYRAGYARIPELADPALLQEVDHNRFQDAGEWLSNLVDRVATARAQAMLAKQLPDATAAQLDQKLAEARSRMPNPDLIPPRSAGNGGQYRTQTDWDGAFARDEITRAQYVEARRNFANMPYSNEE